LPEWLALTIALIVLAGTLAAAVSEARWAMEAAVAVLGAALLVALGALSPSQAWDALGDLAPTAAFLAALLVLAEACRRAGLFDALGTWLAAGSHGSPSRLLALVFAVAATVTAVLSLDATVLLLTPVVLATALRLRTVPRPHVYASAHLANSASLLLPVSNLTNLLAFHASGLSFARFAALMAAPWAGVIAVEWGVLRRTFRDDLRRRGRPRPPWDASRCRASPSRSSRSPSPGSASARWRGSSRCGLRSPVPSCCRCGSGRRR
jgi:arsenical pump membrane protein